MSVMWPGPGRALQAHLDLFRHVDRAHDWIVAHAGQGATPAQLDAAPETMRQRLRLMATMGTLADEPGATERYSQFNVERAVGQVNNEWDVLNRGETHYISHHVTSMLIAAADQAGDEPLFPTDLPCPQGLMVFEYPLLIPDLHPATGEVVDGLEMPVRAIAWGPADDVHSVGADGETVVRPGIYYSLYTDEEAWKKLFVTSVARELPDEFAAYEHVYEAVTRDPLWCIDTSAWTYGTAWERSLDTSPSAAFGAGKVHRTVADVRRFMLALFRFEFQRLLVPETYRPTRHEVKRASRAGLKIEDGYVKVLRLRRHVEMEARGERVESDPLAYDHQWIVRGHPRRQWFPSLGPARNPDGSFNVDSHRLIWIDPHYKGNPYAPLVIGHNITAVVR